MSQRGWVVRAVAAAAVAAMAFLAGLTGAGARAAGLAAIERVDGTLSPVRGAIERYTADRAALQRFYRLPMSSSWLEKARQFDNDWLTALQQIEFDKLDQDGRVDYLLFRNHLTYRLQSLEYERQRDEQLEELIPFAEEIVELEMSRRRMQPVDSQKAAGQLADMAGRIKELKRAVADKKIKASRSVANRAAKRLGGLRRTLGNWFRFYKGYDPQFTWWVSKPYQEVDQQMQQYAELVREKLAGIKKGDKETIIGDPIGRDALLVELRHEMIPFTPEELIAIANRELSWCQRQMRRAADQLGFGDDWRKALEHVKQQHVAPGKQPELIHKLAREAEQFVTQRRLVTVPALCSQIWRMQMMSPELQKVNPYFTGGEVITVAYPTAEMSYADKLMSMRGNNVHFARATVHHELIPGHHLQGFMAARYRTHRRIFSTPFLVEGWALYWEMLLWDKGFAQTPEDHIGMLFWRTHRCARIIFSLQFHLGQMTPQQAIEFLIKTVGHERNNATAEVRRSVSGSYPPLYQSAYMLGGLQLRDLHRELVGSGRMTDLEFHDAVLRQNAIPIALIRAALTGEKLTRDWSPQWRWYEPKAE